MQWKTPTSPKMKKPRISKSQVRAMIVFFIRRVIMNDEGQTVIQKYYLTKLREQVRKKGLEEWKSRIWYQENMPAHVVLSVNFKPISAFLCSNLPYQFTRFDPL
jgi:hypothetical protein